MRHRQQRKRSLLTKKKKKPFMLAKTTQTEENWSRKTLSDVLVIYKAVGLLEQSPHARTHTHTHKPTIKKGIKTAEKPRRTESRSHDGFCWLVARNMAAVNKNNVEKTGIR